MKVCELLSLKKPGKYIPIQFKDFETGQVIQLPWEKMYNPLYGYNKEVFGWDIGYIDTIGLVFNVYIRR